MVIVLDKQPIQKNDLIRNLVMRTTSMVNVQHQQKIALTTLLLHGINQSRCFVPYNERLQEVSKRHDIDCIHDDYCAKQ